MKKVVIVTPHPDDETLGCGGTLLKHGENGEELYWMIVTGMNDQFSDERRGKRTAEIEKVTQWYGFKKVFQLNYSPATLDQIPLDEMISKIGEVFMEIEPNFVYVPYPGDIHSDHRAVFEASVACTKWFRHPYVQKVFVYETLSETDFTINPDTNGFRPNVFVNIQSYLDKKMEIMNLYESEVGEHPFPRSEKAIRSLAYVRGATSGYEAAEAFMLLKERIQ